MQTAAQGADMNAPDNNAPTQADGVVDWLTSGTRDERFIDDIFAQMCIRLQQAGIPLKRATLHVMIHHPQWLGARMMWSDGKRRQRNPRRRRRGAREARTGLLARAQARALR
jgi:adenylate cyclase